MVNIEELNIHEEAATLSRIIELTYHLENRREDLGKIADNLNIVTKGIYIPITFILAKYYSNDTASIINNFLNRIEDVNTHMRSVPKDRLREVLDEFNSILIELKK